MDIVDKIAKVEVGANDKPKLMLKLKKSIFFKKQKITKVRTYAEDTF